MLYLSVSSTQSPWSTQTPVDLASFDNWVRSYTFAGVNLDIYPTPCKDLQGHLASDTVLPKAFCKCIFWDMREDASWVTCMMSLRASTGQGSSTQQTSRQGVLSPVVGAQPSFHSSHTPLPPPSTRLASCPPLAHFSSVSHTAGIQRLKHFSSMKETAPSSLTPPWVDKTQAQPVLESA